MNLVRALLTVGLVAFTLSARPALASQIPAPTNLTATTDVHVCGVHAGLIGAGFCPGALAHGQLVLVFSWIGNKGYPSQNGFNVYEVDGGQHKLVDSNTSQATVGFIARPAGARGFGGRCYGVTAVVGNKQSGVSKQACMPLTFAAPTLSTTRNLATCATHTGSGPIFYVQWVHRLPHEYTLKKIASCAKAFAMGPILVVTWDWPPCPVGCLDVVDGFTVYDTYYKPSGSRIGDIPFHTTAFAAVAPGPRYLVQSTACYQVRAYVNLRGGGTRKSDLSNRLCL